jgi:hypothetical protein
MQYERNSASNEPNSVLETQSDRRFHPYRTVCGRLLQLPIFCRFCFKFPICFNFPVFDGSTGLVQGTLLTRTVTIIVSGAAYTWRNPECKKAILKGRKKWVIVQTRKLPQKRWRLGTGDGGRLHEYNSAMARRCSFSYGWILLSNSRPQPRDLAAFS